MSDLFLNISDSDDDELIPPTQGFFMSRQRYQTKKVTVVPQKLNFSIIPDTQKVANYSQNIFNITDDDLNKNDEIDVINISDSDDTLDYVEYDEKQTNSNRKSIEQELNLDLYNKSINKTNDDFLTNTENQSQCLFTLEHEVNLTAPIIQDSNAKIIETHPYVQNNENQTNSNRKSIEQELNLDLYNKSINKTNDDFLTNTENQSQCLFTLEHKVSLTAPIVQDSNAKIIETHPYINSQSDCETDCEDELNDHLKIPNVSATKKDSKGSESYGNNESDRETDCEEELNEYSKTPNIPKVSKISKSYCRNESDWETDCEEKLNEHSKIPNVSAATKNSKITDGTKENEVETDCEDELTDDMSLDLEQQLAEVCGEPIERKNKKSNLLPNCKSIEKSLNIKPTTQEYENNKNKEKACSANNIEEIFDSRKRRKSFVKESSEKTLAKRRKSVYDKTLNKFINKKITESKECKNQVDSNFSKKKELAFKVNSNQPVEISKNLSEKNCSSNKVVSETQISPEKARVSKDLNSKKYLYDLSTQKIPELDKTHKKKNVLDSDDQCKSLGAKTSNKEYYLDLATQQLPADDIADQNMRSSTKNRRKSIFELSTQKLPELDKTNIRNEELNSNNRNERTPIKESFLDMQTQRVPADVVADQNMRLSSKNRRKSIFELSTQKLPELDKTNIRNEELNSNNRNERTPIKESFLDMQTQRVPADVVADQNMRLSSKNRRKSIFELSTQKLPELDKSNIRNEELNSNNRNERTPIKESFLDMQTQRLPADMVADQNMRLSSKNRRKSIFELSTQKLPELDKTNIRNEELNSNNRNERTPIKESFLDMQTQRVPADVVADQNMRLSSKNRRKSIFELSTQKLPELDKSNIRNEELNSNNRNERTPSKKSFLDMQTQRLPADYVADQNMRLSSKNRRKSIFELNTQKLPELDKSNIRNEELNSNNRNERTPIKESFLDMQTQRVPADDVADQNMRLSTKNRRKSLFELSTQKLPELDKSNIRNEELNSNNRNERTPVKESFLDMQTRRLPADDVADMRLSTKIRRKSIFELSTQKLPELDKSNIRNEELNSNNRNERTPIKESFLDMQTQRVPADDVADQNMRLSTKNRRKSLFELSTQKLPEFDKSNIRNEELNSNNRNERTPSKKSFLDMQTQRLPADYVADQNIELNSATVLENVDLPGRSSKCFLQTCTNTPVTKKPVNLIKVLRTESNNLIRTEKKTTKDEKINSTKDNSNSYLNRISNNNEDDRQELNPSTSSIGKYSSHKKKVSTPKKHEFFACTFRDILPDVEHIKEAGEKFKKNQASKSKTLTEISDEEENVIVEKNFCNLLTHGNRLKSTKENVPFRRSTRTRKNRNFEMFQVEPIKNKRNTKILEKNFVSKINENQSTMEEPPKKRKYNSRKVETNFDSKNNESIKNNENKSTMEEPPKKRKYNSRKVETNLDSKNNESIKNNENKSTMEEPQKKRKYKSRKVDKKLETIIDEDESMEQQNKKDKINRAATIEKEIPKPKLQLRVLLERINIGEYQLAIENLGGIIVNSAKVADILVMQRYSKTPRFVSSVAKGIPIVVENWLIQSIKENKFVDSDKYLLKDLKLEEDYKFSLGVSLKLARIESIFNGYTILVTNNVSSKKEIIADIIECAGGKCVFELDELPTSSKIMAISTKIDKPEHKKIKKKHPKILISNYEGFVMAIYRQTLNFKDILK